MFKNLLGIAATAALALSLSIATADQADAKPKWKGDKHHGGGWGGGPPPWAPAHGWRAKYGGSRYGYDRRRHSRDDFGYRRW